MEANLLWKGLEKSLKVEMLHPYLKVKMQNSGFDFFLVFFFFFILEQKLYLPWHDGVFL